MVEFDDVVESVESHFAETLLMVMEAPSAAIRRGLRTAVERALADLENGMTTSEWNSPYVRCIRGELDPEKSPPLALLARLTWPSGLAIFDRWDGKLVKWFAEEGYLEWSSAMRAA